MNAETTVATPTSLRFAVKSERAPALTLDRLAALSAPELRELYAAGRAPAHMSLLDGDLTGRMLVVRPFASPRLASSVAALARHWAFPWGGKSFSATSAHRGTGINRVRLFGQHRLFPFTTRIAPSLIDGKPCVILDYDHAENPGFIRMIHDEVREVGSSNHHANASHDTRESRPAEGRAALPSARGEHPRRLFLGPACLKRQHAAVPTHVLWFALDAHTRDVLAYAPCPPIPPPTPTTRSTTSS